MTNEIIEKPKCAFKNCDNLAFVLFHGKWCCGKCVAEASKKEQEKFWNDND